MKERAGLLPGSISAETLYLGGGTPSLLQPQLVARFIETARECYGLRPDAEITLEANPGTVTPESLAGYRAAGVNRLSLGIQSFNDGMLATLGRVHTVREAREAVAAARGVGFDNLGIDLIHSLPGETEEDWHKELLQAVALGPEHISTYGLTLEEGTPLYRLRESGQLTLPDEDAGALMFRMTTDILGAAGYEQYEISNFARPGRRSLHNQVYWRRGSCLGFGSAAHSFLANPSFGHRWHNPDDPDEYMRSLLTGIPVEEDLTLLSLEDAMAETFFLGLRTTDGVDTKRFQEIFGKTVQEVYGTEIECLLDAGLLQQHGSRLSIPAPLFLLSNQILVKFV